MTHSEKNNIGITADLKASLEKIGLSHESIAFMSENYELLKEQVLKSMTSEEISSVLKQAEPKTLEKFKKILEEVSTHEQPNK